MRHKNLRGNKILQTTKLHLKNLTKTFFFSFSENPSIHKNSFVQYFLFNGEIGKKKHTVIPQIIEKTKLPQWYP